MTEDAVATRLAHVVLPGAWFCRILFCCFDLLPGLKSGEEVKTTLNGGLFGALRDAAPDSWGRAVIERRSHRRPEHELDYLLATSDIRVGALGFGDSPEPKPIDYSAALSLEHLERLEVAMSQAEAIEAEAVGERLNVAIDPALLSPSSSLGGARPKTTVIDGSGQLWIAKFPSRHDRWNNAIVEAAYLRLASEFGIRTPEACILRIGNRCVLLVRRFDQSPGPSGAIRKPFLSAHTLLGSDESVIDHFQRRRGSPSRR